MDDYDPRVVALYDDNNRDGPDHDFYRELADTRGSRSVLDLGCGTGMLTVTLATAGRRVVGVDPSAAMLAYARARNRGEKVEWINGHVTTAPEELFDLVVMTGNVSQHIADAEWVATLSEIRRRMVLGGTLAFETRNPAYREWERWVGPPARRHTRVGDLTEWMDVRGGGTTVVQVRTHNVFHATGDTVVEELHLTYRTREEVEISLQKASFTTESVLGDWSGAPPTDSSRLLIFTARAAEHHVRDVVVKNRERRPRGEIAGSRASR